MKVTQFLFWLKCSVDKLNYSDANQVILSHSTCYRLVITETKIVFIKYAHCTEQYYINSEIRDQELKWKWCGSTTGWVGSK